MITQYSVAQLNDAIGCISAGPGSNRWALRRPVAEQMLRDGIMELDSLRRQSEKICQNCKVKFPPSPDENCPSCAEPLTPLPVALAQAHTLTIEKYQERVAFLEELVSREYDIKGLTE